MKIRTNRQWRGFQVRHKVKLELFRKWHKEQKR